MNRKSTMSINVMIYIILGIIVLVASLYLYKILIIDKAKPIGDTSKDITEKAKHCLENPDDPECSEFYYGEDVITVDEDQEESIEGDVCYSTDKLDLKNMILSVWYDGNNKASYIFPNQYFVDIVGEGNMITTSSILPDLNVGSSLSLILNFNKPVGDYEKCYAVKVCYDKEPYEECSIFIDKSKSVFSYSFNNLDDKKDLVIFACDENGDFQKIYHYDTKLGVKKHHSLIIDIPEKCQKEPDQNYLAFFETDGCPKSWTKGEIITGYGAIHKNMVCCYPPEFTGELLTIDDIINSLEFETEESDITAVETG